MTSDDGSKVVSQDQIGLALAAFSVALGKTLLDVAPPARETFRTNLWALCDELGKRGDTQAAAMLVPALRAVRHDQLKDIGLGPLIGEGVMPDAGESGQG